eukprot:46082-Eustigmatos_ZCMA.PRE.1
MLRPLSRRKHVMVVGCYDCLDAMTRPMRYAELLLEGLTAQRKYGPCCAHESKHGAPVRTPLADT